MEGNSRGNFVARAIKAASIDSPGIRSKGEAGSGQKEYLFEWSRDFHHLSIWLLSKNTPLPLKSIMRI
jgi:hypothetical protein